MCCIFQVTCSPTLLDQWWTSSLDFSLYCRFLGQRTPLLLGTASIGEAEYEACDS